MITMKYIDLPVQSLSYNFIYKLEGDIELDWTFGAISHNLTIMTPFPSQVDLKESFARGQASIVDANSKGKIRHVDDFKDTEVKLISMGVETVEQHEPLGTLSDVKRLIVEYVQIPKKDERVHFLFRFVAPIEMVWTLQSADWMVMDIPSYDEGVVKQLVRHVSVRDIINRDAMRTWKNQLMSVNSANPAGELRQNLEIPPELQWMMDLRHVEIRECKLVEGGKLVNDTMTEEKAEVATTNEVSALNQALAARRQR